MKLKIYRRCWGNLSRCTTFRVVLKKFRGNGPPATISKSFWIHLGYDFDGCSDWLVKKLDDSKSPFVYLYRSWTSMTQGNLNRIPLHKIEPNGYAAPVYRILEKGTRVNAYVSVFFFFFHVNGQSGYIFGLFRYIEYRPSGWECFKQFDTQYLKCEAHVHIVNDNTSSYFQ